LNDAVVVDSCYESNPRATGIYEVRSFLQGQANEDVINEAIKNLSLYRQVHIKAA
jgi:hypothetical protein